MYTSLDSNPSLSLLMMMCPFFLTFPTASTHVPSFACTPLALPLFLSPLYLPFLLLLSSSSSAIPPVRPPPPAHNSIGHHPRTHAADYARGHLRQPQPTPTAASHSIHTHHQRHPATAVSRRHRLPPQQSAPPTAVPVYPTAVCRSPSPSLPIPIVLLPSFGPATGSRAPTGDDPLRSPPLPVLQNTHTSCETPVEPPSLPLLSPPQRL